MTTETNSQRRLGAVLFYGVVAILVYLAYLIFAPFLAPLAWAGVLVVVFYPWHEKLAKRWGRTRASAVSATAVTLILIVPVLFVMALFLRQGVSAARSAQLALSSGQLDWVNRAWVWISTHVRGESGQDLATLVRDGAERMAGLLAGQVGNALQHILRFFFELTVVLFAMFYFFRDGEDVLAGLRRVLPFEHAQRERMITDARDLIYASVTSSLAAAVAHGLVGGIGFAIVGISAPVFWGVLMAFFSFVPLVGSSLVWVPASVILMARGHLGRGICLLVICAALLGVMDNVVRPWLISGRARLGGLLVFIGVIGGIGVFGILGVVLGPIVVAMTASVLDLYSVDGTSGVDVRGKSSGEK